MSLKLSDKNTNGNGAAADAAADAPKLRDNTEINAKIDAYIQANPKEWEYIKSRTFYQNAGANARSSKT
jgi:hypothetical protein